MSFRTTYILFGVTAFLLVALGFYVFLADTEPTGEGYLLPSFQTAGYKPSDITTVEIQRTGQSPETLVFVRQGKDSWKLTKPLDARIDPHAVEAIVRDLLNAKRDEKGVDIGDKGKHGLDNPAVTVVLRKGTDREATVAIGHVGLGDDRAPVYVLSSDSKSNRPWVVRKSALRGLFKFPAPEGAADTAALVKGVNDFRATKLLADVADAVQQTAALRLVEGKKEIAFRRQPDGNWLFEQPVGFGVVEVEGQFNPAGTAAVNTLRSLLQHIFAIQVPTPADFIDKPEDLSKYGLNADSPDLLRIELERRPMTGEDPTGTVTLLVGKSTGVGDKFFAKLANESTVAQVAGVNVRAIKGVLEDPKALRNRDLLKLTAEQVDAIDIENASGKVELRLTGLPAAWKVYDAGGTAAPASRLAVTNMLTALTTPRAVVDFPPVGADDKSLGFDGKSPEIRIWVGGIIKEEPKKDEPKKDESKKDEAKKDEPKKDSKEVSKKEEPKKEATPPVPDRPKLAGEPTVRLIFGKESDATVCVRRIEKGVKTDLLVSKALLAHARQTRLDVLDVSLPPLVNDQVVKVSFTKGKEHYEIEKETKDAPVGAATWKIVSPEARKGRLADSARIGTLLMELGQLRSMRVLAEKPGADELARQGLDPKAPRLRITLTLKDAAAGSGERVFYFGNDQGADKQNVAARVAGQEVIFEAPRPAVDTVEKNDFLDTVVFRVDAAKVKGLKLRGWTDVTGGEPLTRELEKQGGRWVFKSKMPYDPDPEKVETLLLDLLTPRAEGFVVLKNGPAPEHGLDLGKGALEVEIDVDGGKPVTLMLGSTDASGRSVYAQTNQLPGDVFTLLKDRFKSVREKPAVFKKE